KVAEAYNIGNSDTGLTILQLAERLVGLFPERGLKVIRQERAAGGYLPSAIERSCPDASKARALGWSPKTGIDEGFSRTIGSYE
ncbi:MAG: UDP-glucuronate decarboxylase, partial [Candidatus Wallbacteria bacterium]|nr:UDP-glucuronate decarboxylase [Candidatus Wallbacteria bacterium]